MAKDQNLAVVLKNQNGDIIYGNNEVILLKFSKFIINRPKEEHRETIKLKANDSKTPYTLEVVMTLQPVDEASDVISKLMPYIILIALLIGMIGAYIYSNVITKPLIEVIESEREAENRRKDFVATISHELKTPITIISGQLEGMIYNIGKYKDRDTYLQKSYDSVQELKDLVNEMMEVSKSEILITELKLTKVNFSELLNKLVHRQMFLIEEKYLNVDLQIQENISVKLNATLTSEHGIIYQVCEPEAKGPNENIIKVFKDNTYYAYDGSLITAKKIANAKAKELNKDTYTFNGEKYSTKSDMPIEKRKVNFEKNRTNFEKIMT